MEREREREREWERARERERERERERKKDRERERERERKTERDGGAHGVMVIILRNDKMLPDMKAGVDHWISICRKNTPVNFHQQLMNVYGNEIGKLSTVRHWVISFTNDDNNISDRSYQT